MHARLTEASKKLSSLLISHGVAARDTIRSRTIKTLLATCTVHYLHDRWQGLDQFPAMHIISHLKVQASRGPHLMLLAPGPRPESAHRLGQPCAAVTGPCAAQYALPSSLHWQLQALLRMHSILPALPPCSSILRL